MVVTGVGTPPVSATRQIGPFSPLNRIVPSRLHVPPPDHTGDSHTIWGEPSVSAIRFTRPLAKKAIERPSGDQNGCDESSVPSSIRLATESNRRNQRCLVPSDESAT